MHTMLDYQRIVDDVRSILFDKDDDEPVFLQGAAADYSRAIDEVNERLRHCGALLNRGLRSEAIQLCELEPNLLDVVRILAFPERGTWNRRLVLHGISPPPALMFDVADKLNEAYADEKPLAMLLQRHRLLAMSHAPIKLRLDTLRRLCDADLGNPVWVQDVRTFEGERVRELRREVLQAIAGGDLAALDPLALELENSAWLIEGPELLNSQIAAARSNAARVQGLGQLRRIADCLNAMHAAGNVEGGHRERAQWEPLMATWGQFVEPSLLQMVAAPLDWLREQDELAEQAARHEWAVDILDRAVTSRRSAKELERLHHEAKRGGEIPEEVEQRYCEQLEALDFAARRSIRLKLAVFAWLIIVIGAIAATEAYRRVQAGRVDRAVASLEQLVRDNKIDETRSFIDELGLKSPRIAADPRIQEIGRQLTTRLMDEQGPRRDFATALELVRKSIADQLPDKEALAKAKSLATNAKENAEIWTLEQEIARLGDEAQSKVDQGFLGQLKEYKDRVDTIEKDLEDRPDASIDKLNHLEIELTRLQEASTRTSPAAKKAGELLRTRVKELEEEIRTAGQRLNREEAITAACGDNAAFRQRLLEYAEEFPQARRSGSFRAVAGGEATLWDWIGEWNETVRAVGRRNCASFDQKTAAEAAAKLRKLLVERSGHPDADAFNRRLPYLDAIAERIDGEGNPIEAALKPLFTDPFLARIWMLTDTAGQRYYLLDDPASKFGPLNALQPGGAYGFEYVVDFNLSKKRKSLRGSAVDSRRAVASQRTTAKTLAAILEGMTDESWELSFCRMIETVLNDHDTDPLLKYILMRKIVAVGCQGSLCLHSGFARYVEVFKDSKVPTSLNWVDPDNSEAIEERPIAEAELGKLPSFIDARNSTVKLQRSLGVAIGVELTCVGWLRKNMAGDLQCLTISNCPESGRLVTVRSVRTEGQKQPEAVFDTIGRLDKGKAKIDAVPEIALAQGRPVYVVNPPPK